ncbi:hypothetical protein CAMSH0001_0333 [Campylobacter showae RM3277]|uniref:Uncharacterized protein n=1 Tax=Campylobacter showae RM3277 TaxID=553219 RepID=C6RF29_9BACT|nr:hypothetical protein CAMSH0001_0333 [Campylobacter showae RM3277]
MQKVYCEFVCKKADFNPSAQHKFDAANLSRVKFESNFNYLL